MTPFEWIVTEGDKAIFGQADAIRITGFSPPTFQNWANRDIVTPETKGAGTRRKYSGRTLAIMAIASTLQELNISAASAMMTATNIWIDAVKELGHNSRKRQARYSELRNAIAIIKAESKIQHNVLVTSDGSKLPLKDLFSGYPCIVLAIGPIIERIAEGAMDLATEADTEAE